MRLFSTSYREVVTAKFWHAMPAEERHSPETSSKILKNMYRKCLTRNTLAKRLDNIQKEQLIIRMRNFNALGRIVVQSAVIYLIGLSVTH